MALNCLIICILIIIILEKQLVNLAKNRNPTLMQEIGGFLKKNVLICQTLHIKYIKNR